MFWTDFCSPTMERNMSRTEKLLNKAQDIWEENLRTLDGLPDPADVCRYNDNDWYKLNYQRLREILHQRHRLGFSTGVFHTLAAIGLDEKKERNQTFKDGAGI